MQINQENRIIFENDYSSLSLLQDNEPLRSDASNLLLRLVAFMDGINKLTAMVLDILVTYKNTLTTDNKFLVCCADRLMTNRKTQPHKDLIFALSAFLFMPAAHCTTFCSYPTHKPDPATTKRDAIFTAHLGQLTLNLLFPSLENF